MKVNYCLRVSIMLALGIFAGLVQGKEAAPPTAQEPKIQKIDPDNITVLMGSDAKLIGGLKEMYPGTGKRFWVTDWKSTNDRFEWTLEVPTEDDYSVMILVRNETRSGDSCDLELSSGEKKLTHTVKRLSSWDRQTIEGTLRLPAGRSVLTLRATQLPTKPKLSLFSAELVCSGARSALDERVQALRAGTDWMLQSKYGLMFTWTAASKPRSGPAKPYAEAVKDFDVNKFAAMCKQTGAGFVVFATSWADYYFPGPIKAIDDVVQGHTAQRDLVSDLSDALGKHGIKLILYYHPGHGDAAWWSKTGYDKEDKTEFFNLWCRVITEAGERYGKKLAGWWFDDGIACYYPYRAPWEKMTKAAKIGNPDRVVGYNAWILPKATEFQDLSMGEGDFTEFIGKEYLPIGGSGRFVAGPQKGLQACLTWMLEPGNWCHLDPDKEIAAPSYTKERLTGLMRACVARRIVPMINMETYQDGTPGPASVEVLHAVSEALQDMKESAKAVKEDVGPPEPRKGDIMLESADGKIEGTYLTYVDNVDCITCWRNPKGKVKWSFTAPETGKYKVLVSCVHGMGPSEYAVNVDDQKLTGKIADTGAEPGWSDYKDYDVGTVELVNGKTHEVTIQVTLMPKKGSPMNLRRIILRPAK